MIFFNHLMQPCYKSACLAMFISVFVSFLAALRAYLREGNCHLQQTSRGWRGAAPSHGVSGLRHSATRYEAMVHA